MEVRTLDQLVVNLESGGREKGGSVNSGVISIGGTQISDDGGFKWNKMDFISESFFSKMTSGKVKQEDILIVKDGATTGKVSFVDSDFPFEKAAVNEHVFKLEINKTLANPKYVFYCLFSPYGQREILNDFRGATVGGISRNFINLVNIPLADRETQDKIVTVLDKAQNLVEKREKTIEHLNQLVKSIFWDMFGNPITNEKKWNKSPLKEFGEIITGNTPPRSNSEYYDGQFIEWIKTNNIFNDDISLEKADEYLSEAGFDVSRYVEKNSLLIACIAGSLSSIGRCAISDRRVAFNQQINAIVPKEDVSVYFLYWMFNISQAYIQSFATPGMKKLITKGEFEKIEFIRPEYNLQQEFELVALSHYKSFKALHRSRIKLKNLQNALSQLAFKGDLLFNTAVDLEILLENDYIFFKENSNDITIQLLLDRLDKAELNEKKLYDGDMYNKAKDFVFELLKEGKIKQTYDGKSQKVKVTL
jgi:type I restriction enzyme S subunit